MRRTKRTGTTGARAGTRGARSKTRDAAGNFHLDYEYSHRGEKDHHIDRHDVHEARAPFQRKPARIRHVVAARKHAPFEDEAERRARGEHKRAPAKKGSWHKGMKSKTKDSKGNFHKDAVTHEGDKRYHRGGHDERHRQGSAAKSKPFKDVGAAQKVIDRLKGKTNGDAEKLRKLRRAVAFKNAHHRYHK